MTGAARAAVENVRSGRMWAEIDAIRGRKENDNAKLLSRGADKTRSDVNVSEEA